MPEQLRMIYPGEDEDGIVLPPSSAKKPASAPQHDDSMMGPVRMGPGGIPERMSSETAARHAAKAERLSEQFVMPRLAGLAALARKVGGHGLTMVVAMAVIQRHIVRGEPYVLSGIAAARIGMTERERRTAAKLLAGMPEWFEVTHGQGKAPEVTPTEEALAALHAGRR